MASIEHVQYINTPASKVFQMLASEEGLAAVWTSELEFSARLGAINEFRFGGENPTLMRVTDIGANRLMEWECIGSDPEWIGTRVGFELHEHEGRTTVTLRHSGWKRVTEFYRSCNYNWAIFLLSLKECCEGRRGFNFQSRQF